MTNQEILTKAIEKAIAGGWNGTKNQTSDDWLGYVEKYANEAEFSVLIFNHDFARSLWGEELIDVFEGYFFDFDGSEHNGYTQNPAWKVNLQAMVIADDPIKYLGKNI